MKYAIYYWYRDPAYGKVHEGTYYCNDLTDVYAFTAMVERYGGSTRCSI